VSLGPVVHLISESLARTSSELAILSKLSPDGIVTNELKTKSALFEKALNWILHPSRKWPATGREIEA
jgi:hypothetical protein